MQKEALLAQSKMSKGISTLLGGQVPSEVVHNNHYIPLMTAGDRETAATENEELNSSLTLEHVILTALSENRDRGKPVIMVGSAGAGKTTALEKLMVDWASGQHLQHFSHVIHFQFRELNSLKKTLSLEALLLQCYTHLSPESMGLVLQNPESLLFVFDGFDQYQHSLELPTSPTLCSDPHQPVSASCLVASLVHGTLLKGAAILLASRPVNRLETLNGHRVELLGFLKPQRKAYFHRFFHDPGVASQALLNMERTVGFYDFCASPRFCWTICSIYKSLLNDGERLPETLSQVFASITVHLILGSSLDEAQARDLVFALGRMASHCSLAQRTRCSKEELTSLGLQQFLTSQTSVNAFLCVDGDLESDDCAFSFHTQMMAEFLLAASFYLEKSKSESVDEMLERYEDHAVFLDLYLSGLSNSTQRKSLESRLGEFSSDRIMDFRRWFRSTSQKALEGFRKEQHFHCFRLLHQSQDEGLVKEVIITPSARIGMSYAGLGVQDCVALNYTFTHLEVVEQLNLYRTTDISEILVPAMRLAQKIILSQTSLSTGSLSHLASALSNGRTVELDLSYSRMGDAGFKVLSAGLRTSNLLTLSLLACKLTEGCCGDLVAVLTSEASQLHVLDLGFNELHDQGLKLLSQALLSPHCRLQDLQIYGCELTGESMEPLAAALCAGQSELRILNLSRNSIGDSGMEELAKCLQHPHCQLQVLKLSDNELTGACCASVAAALQSEKCCLRELDLSVNELDQEGALLLCRALTKSGLLLETLSLVRCELTPVVYQELGALLISGSSRLKSLSVGLNDIGDEGAKHLWDAVADKRCQLEYLDVEMIKLSDACLADLCAAVRASGSMKSLVLKNNLLTDKSVPALVALMQDSRNMQELNLQYNDFSEDVFELMDQCDKIRY